uniref:Peptidase C1A papain C-terminal domain-containing protein n=1 Tax=Leersia perrieri TaxID=77586 RepID=A0A0D9V935_9ORYZ
MLSQEVYDCSDKKYVHSYNKAFDWITYNGGVASEAEHPQRYACESFSAYRGGIFTSPCGNTSHAILVVRHGVAAFDIKYWIVKNFYGPNWGDHGYIYIQRVPDGG